MLKHLVNLRQNSGKSPSIEVIPPAVEFAKTAYFLLLCRYPVFTKVRNEFHDSVVIEQTAALGSDDIEPTPVYRGD
jgi:hypothetical protein